VWHMQVQHYHANSVSVNGAATLGGVIPYGVMTASQSSTSSGGLASRALTASPQTTWPGTCTHTEDEDQSWWKVSLQGTYSVTHIELTSRNNCCPERLQGIDVYVDATKCASAVSVDEGGSKTVSCVGSGSSIKLQHPTKSSLTLCGFRAWGTPVSGVLELGAACSSHDACNSGICAVGACSPCVGNSCLGKFCWNGKCLPKQEDRNDNQLACGDCPAGYKCKVVEDIGETGKACVRDCPVGKGGAKCQERCSGGALSCANGEQTVATIPGVSSQYNHAQSTYCSNMILARNAVPTKASEAGNAGSVVNGVVFGYCHEKHGQYCIGDMEPRKDDGSVAFECVKYTKTTYQTSNPLWIKEGRSSGQRLCIRPLCEVIKRVKCVGTQCWSQKFVRNFKNECQWLGCSHHAGTAADRVPNNQYCKSTATLA